MMNKEELCMNCMNPLPAGRDTCGICGHSVNAQNDAFCLPVGTMLSERYLVGVGVVEGGDRITYIGMDTVAKSPCQIHEFFPYTLCERDTDMTVRIIGGCENTYADYKTKFLSHARALARMRDVAILYPTYDIFEDNNTAYVITEVEEGQTWEAYLSAKGGRMRWDDVRPLLIPLLVGVRSLHAAGVLHMGISTKTVMVDNEGRLRLRGFMIPEARTVSGDLKPALATGYAAPEQYNFDAPITTSTDVYGLTATLFRVLTGAPAPDAGNRAAAGNDLFVPASVAEELPDQVAVSLFNGLQVVADRRPRKVEQWQEALTASAAVNDLLVEDDDDGAAAVVIPDFDEEPREGKKSKRGVMIAVIALCVFLVLFLLAFGIIKMLFPEMFGGGDSTGTTTTTSTTASSTQPTTSTTYGDYNPQHVVPEVLNKNYYELIHETLNGNMVLKIDKMVISDKPAGTILEQNPAPSASADKGTTITVVISAGKETITVPDMTGWEEQYARLFLEQCGFKVGESIPLLVSTQEAGRVDKTDLEVGIEVKRNSVIRLYISTPPTTQIVTDPTDPSDTGDNTTSTDTETGVTEPSYSFVG
ncbi:MAG: PASTA domain-containing protein [Clostridia bacterium]|nr:PASTA domain-containing protein [Clostridia bacterium]